MVEAFSLLDKRKNTAYLLAGDYRDLIESALPRNGILGLWRKARLLIGYYLPKKPLSEPQRMFVDKISNLMGGRITSLLFYSTDHLQTRWRGVLESDGQLFSIKVFQNRDDAYHEATQTKIVEQYFTGPFIVPHVVQCQDGILISRFVPRMRGILAEDGVLDRLQYATIESMNKSTSFKVPKDIVPLNFPGLFVKLENSELTRRVKEWLAGHPDQMPIIPIHGDMTPWNIYVDESERLVLSSFERAGWQVPFYDVFHFYLQPQALLSRSAAPVTRILADLPWRRYPWLEVALVLYLVDQLCCDLGDLYDKQYNDPWLLPMIRKKERWLWDLLDRA